MKIHFLFVYNHAWWAILSPVIKRLENVDFSHCAIGLEHNGKFLVYESTWPKGKVSEYSEFSRHYEVIHDISFDVPEYHQYKVSKFLDNSVGIVYSFVQLVVIAAGKIHPKLNHWLKNWTWNGNTSLVCTELVARFLDRFTSNQFDESFDYIGCDEVFFAVQGLSFKNLEGVSPWKEGV